MEIFCKSTPTRARTEWVGTGELCISSTSSCIPLPVSLQLRIAAASGSTIKASVTILFVKDLSINDFGIDPGSGFIREVNQLGPSQEWKIRSGAIARAVNGSSIAVVRCSDSNGIMHNRVYYQRPDLHLRESYLERSTVKWVSGEPDLELLVSLNKRSSHCRGFQPWHTTVWNPYNCRIYPWR